MSDLFATVLDPGNQTVINELAPRNPHPNPPLRARATTRAPLPRAPRSW